MFVLLYETKILDQLPHFSHLYTIQSLLRPLNKFVQHFNNKVLKRLAVQCFQGFILVTLFGGGLISHCI